MQEVYDPLEGGKDYILQIRVKNGPLLRALRMRGKTMAQVCREVGLQISAFSNYLTLKNPPINKWGKWKPSALKLAQALNYPPDMLWPEQHLTTALVGSSGELEVSSEEVALLIGSHASNPDRIADREAVMEKLDCAISRLPERQQNVLRRRYWGGLTLREVAEEMGVTQERIRQIECKAMRTLKSPKSHLSAEDCNVIGE